MGLKDKIQAARNPAESEQIEMVARQVARVERDLHTAVQAQYEAVDIEAPPDLMPAGDRVDQLKRLVTYQMDGNLWGYFVSELAPDGLKNTEQAKKHANTPVDEWPDIVERWASAIREQMDDLEDAPDRELADRYTKKRFGVSLDLFERAVVEWSPGRTMEQAVRGPINREIAHINAVSEVLETPAEDPEDKEA